MWRKGIAGEEVGPGEWLPVLRGVVALAEIRAVPHEWAAGKLGSSYD
jgi:hypothetical protein